MSSTLYRLGIAVVNLGLLLGIGLLGLRAYRGGAVDPAEVPPQNFNPLQYEVSFSRQGPNSLLEYRVVWQQLDRPVAAGPAPTPVRPVEAQPTADNLASLYSLMMANYNPRDAASSTVILQGRAGPLTLKVGDKLPDGFEVTSIIIQGSGDSRQATVTVSRGAQQQQIVLRRSEGQ